MSQVDAPSPSASPKVEDSMEVDLEVKREQEEHEEQEEQEEQEPAEDETSDTGPRTAKSGEPLSNQQYKALKEITDKLTNHKITRRGDENYYPSTLFKRIPNKRNLPDYHEIIKEPAAISTLKGKIQRKEYENMKQPVRDFALIVHNAQVYNRPNSAPVRDVFELKGVFEEELNKMLEKGLIAVEDMGFPDLGEIPYATPEPDPVSEEEEEGDEDEEDEDDEGDDSEDEKGKRGRRRGPRGSLAGKKRERSEDGQKGSEPKKRGRPPKVDTPMEARIKAVLKGIRKPKDKAGSLKIRHFERLPDKATNMDYFQSIKEPIAVDLIKRKSKRKKYQSLEHFMRDLDLMFKNAMDYNLDESDIYKDALDLQSEAHKLADAEKKKPDSDYMDEDGRIPLPDGILHGSEIYKVGDWIHIQNQNDVTKPIVAQIYRTWQDTEGQKWINACWYYRPEQTVHQFEKHFYPNEVVKTGQYRDHQVEEIVDRCFVMFFTRYSRGRPRNLDPTKEVYVCEARYNEEKHKLNKIKTWASCLPDEVRDKDYEMDLFDQPRKVKKVPTPLLHLLREDQKDGDDPPEPEFKHPNAPPVVGAIYRGLRDENQSPPPEPTPPPPPTPPPQPVRAPSHNMMPRPQSRTSFGAQGDASLAHAQQPPRPSPSVPPQIPPAYQASSASPAPAYPRRESSIQANNMNPYSTVQAGPPQTPSQPHAATYPLQQPQHQAPLSAAHPAHYAGATPSQAYNRAPVPSAPAPQYPVYPATPVNGPRPAEVYVMSESANNMIPADIREQFPQDEQGRVLFFTTPPVDTEHITQGRTIPEKGDQLAHSLRYLAVKADREREREIAARKRQLDDKDDIEINNDRTTESNKRVRAGFFATDGEERDADGRIRVDPDKALEIALAQEQRLEVLKTRALATLAHQLDQGTNSFYRSQYGDKAEEYKAVDALKQQELVKQSQKANGHSTVAAARSVDLKRNPWKTGFKDDYDARY